MTLLKQFVDRKVTSYQKGFNTWQESIVASCQPLVKEGIIENCYVDAIISCVEKYGPYIVIAPNIAMPHSTEGAKGVNETCIGFMKVEEPVHFDLNDPEKDARLFFVLAAVDHDKHLENMMALSEMLMNDELVQDLLEVTCDEDLLALDQKYA